MPGAASYHGHDGVRESLTKFVGTWDDYRVDHSDFAESGDRLYVRAHITGRGKTSGVPVDLEQFQAWTFAEGKLVRMQMFLDEAEARRAAGVEPAGSELSQ
jgi:ketosteroid isomerase-like protein